MLPFTPFLLVLRCLVARQVLLTVGLALTLRKVTDAKLRVETFRAFADAISAPRLPQRRARGRRT